MSAACLPADLPRAYGLLLPLLPPPKGYKSSAEWCSELASLISLISGVSLLAVEEDALQLQLAMRIPTALAPDPAAEAADYKAVSHTLMVHLQPGTSKVRSASLSPGSVNIASIVQAAQGPLRGLPFLLCEVQAALRRHWRRQLLIDAASASYPITQQAAAPSSDGSSSGEHPTVRARLPNNVEAELRVPLGWPDNGSQLALVALHPPAPHIALSGALEELRKAPAADALARGGLLQLLDTVYAATRNMA